jgi:hypothetical protein
MASRASVCAAIAGRRFLQFQYKGRWRVVYPCAHGWLDTGNAALRAHQVSLVAGSLRVAPGRLYLIEHMRGVTVTDQHFDDPPPGYRRDDRGMVRIHCQL